MADGSAPRSPRIINLIVRHTFTPHNNTRLSHLCGPMDAHLRTIEAGLQVSIAHRHEQFKVDGPKVQAQRAMELLQALYERADRPIGADMVQLMLAGDSALEEDGDGAPVLQTRRSELKARTPGQSVYLENIASHDITFGIGPAGTGKTYLAMAKAVQALQRKEVSRIILTRPAVEAGERLGFLPGTLTDKIDPYLRPLFDALHEMLDPDAVPKLIASGTIEVAPLAYMRGRTLNDSFIVLDEAQNTTPEQMKMFLTRLGFNSKMVVTGDITQVDLPTGVSGLRTAEAILQNVDDMNFSYLSSADVVRHSLVSRIVDAYSQFDEENLAKKNKQHGGKR